MKRIVLAGTLCLMLLCSCSGKPLPDGMDEDALLEAGQNVLLMIVDGDYTGVQALFRADVAAELTAEDIGELAARQLDGAGEYRQITDRMTTGQSSNGESYGVAVFFCEYTKDKVLFRAAFDPNMTLIGIELKRQ